MKNSKNNLTIRSTAWHKESFDMLLNRDLPKLLCEKFPVSNFNCTEPGSIELSITSKFGDVTLSFDNIPYPSEKGIFTINKQKVVIPPIVNKAGEDSYIVSCAGEQLLEFIEKRLGSAADDIQWNEEMMRSWLPLNIWFETFFAERGEILKDINPLSIDAHLRKIILDDIDSKKFFDENNYLCPVELSENIDIDKIFSITNGSVIKEGKFVTIDTEGSSLLGSIASLIPFPEHTDSMRLLFGTDLMKMALIPKNPEQPFVQTNVNPPAENSWYGFNLLTGIVSMGVNTHEDGVVISESCAKKMKFDTDVKEGDLFFSRHGYKGIISKILPDKEMPCLKDGTPLEIAVTANGVVTRMNIGMLFEAVTGRIAKKNNTVYRLESFKSYQAEIKAALKDNGFSETGMEYLKSSSEGEEFSFPTTIGYVYWGRAVVTAESRFQLKGSVLLDETHYYHLREQGAYKMIEDIFEADNEGTNKFKILKTGLAQCSINADFSEKGLEFDFISEEKGNMLKLAKSFRHPWSSTNQIEYLPIREDNESFKEIENLNTKLANLLKAKAPEILINNTKKKLEESVHEYFKGSLTSEMLSFTGSYSNGFKATIAPTLDITYDQIGIPFEMAKELYKDQKFSSPDDLAKLMHKSRVLALVTTFYHYNRSPSLISFEPVLTDGKVIRVNPIVARSFNSDFDGDNWTVILPPNQELMTDIKDNLSMVKYVDAGLELYHIMPNQDAALGLAYKSLTEQGRVEIEEILEFKLPEDLEYFNLLYMGNKLKEIKEKIGSVKMLDMMQKLHKLGFESIKNLGCSISPFLNDYYSDFITKEIINSNSKEEMRIIRAEIVDKITSSKDFTNKQIGPQILSLNCRARGTVTTFTQLVGPIGESTHWSDRKYKFISNGFYSGLTCKEFIERAKHGRDVLKYLIFDMQIPWSGKSTLSKGVLGRAMRSEIPGIVFMQAAINGEVDKLKDIDSKLFVGVKV